MAKIKMCARKMNDSCLTVFGMYEIPEARQLLDVFVQGNVRFEIMRDDRLLKIISPVTARLGGTRGQGIRIAIAVHKDDWDKACRLQQKTFG